MKTSKLSAEALRHDSNGITTITFPRLGDSKVFTHAISTRLGGVSRGRCRSLNISHRVQDDVVRVGENRVLLSQVLGLDIDLAAYVDQVHGDQILKLDAGNRPTPGTSLGPGDGLITNEPGVLLMILLADCLPVLFFDPLHKAVGLAHAGWRGTLSHVAAKTLLSMGEAYGTKAEDVRAALGPCIGVCCYEVGEDVFQEFKGVFPWASEVFRKVSPRSFKLDLVEANARQLMEVGIKSENIIRSELCTLKYNDLFYSHRGEAREGKPTGRFGAFIMVNPS